MKKHKKLKLQAGLPPGTLQYVGEAKNSSVRITVIDYDPENIEERHIEDIREVYDYKEKSSVTWINIDGIHDVQIVKTLGMYYNLHPLLQEDIVDTEQRPKVDFFEDNIFVVLHMLSYHPERRRVVEEQVSLVLGENYLLSFQEDKEGDVFGSIRQRLHSKTRGKIRNTGSAYLFYLLIDTIVDNYFVVLDSVAENLENLEEEIIRQNAPRDPTRDLYNMKRQLTMVRKAVRPMRDIVTQLIREEAKFLESDNFYLRDLYDHVVQVSDNTDSYIDVVSNLLDLYLSIIGHKTNDVMKVLTIFSTIFMPLTFIVGVYGMNFEHMPELHAQNGYFVVWGVMIVISILTYIFFKRKKWL
ncbi:MAG: magnesium/cobalt transporter CorA [Microscillaceae bacterium]|nr:magnesium/cobalt transporter CorA [Microscillaceae bacterium]